MQIFRSVLARLRREDNPGPVSAAKRDLERKRLLHGDVSTEVQRLESEAEDDDKRAADLYRQADDAPQGIRDTLIEEADGLVVRAQASLHKAKVRRDNLNSYTADIKAAEAELERSEAVAASEQVREWINELERTRGLRKEMEPRYGQLIAEEARLTNCIEEGVKNLAEPARRWRFSLPVFERQPVLSQIQKLALDSWNAGEAEFQEQLSEPTARKRPAVEPMSVPSRRLAPEGERYLSDEGHLWEIEALPPDTEQRCEAGDSNLAIARSTYTPLGAEPRVRALCAAHTMSFVNQYIRKQQGQPPLKLNTPEAAAV